MSLDHHTASHLQKGEISQSDISFFHNCYSTVNQSSMTPNFASLSNWSCNGHITSGHLKFSKYPKTLPPYSTCSWLRHLRLSLPIFSLPTHIYVYIYILFFIPLPKPLCGETFHSGWSERSSPSVRCDLEWTSAEWFLWRGLLPQRRPHEGRTQKLHLITANIHSAVDGEETMIATSSASKSDDRPQQHSQQGHIIKLAIAANLPGRLWSLWWVVVECPLMEGTSTRWTRPQGTSSPSLLPIMFSVDFMFTQCLHSAMRFI